MRTDIAQADPIEFSSRLKTVASSIGARIHNPGWPVLVAVAVAAVYLVLLPHIERTWRTTGDEPHYLLTAHSLVTDLDFDLTNNYDQLDYLAFYFSRDIERQIRTNAAGQQILDHQLGLAVITAPAYALGGRWGVLAFQAILGGLLAALTFKLAVFISRDERASLLATLVIALTPPLLMYHYLVYPELIGALLTTLVLYFVISRNQPAPAIVAVVILSLLALPWLNRRFVPLAVVLALLTVWAWRKKTIWFGVLGLLTTLVSIFLLWWFQSQLDQPVRADIIAPPEASVLWSRLGRGIGWLLDQQRGLFIFAPVYILTLWGLPLVIYDSYRYSNRHWLVVVPFLVSLGVTVLAAGYYVAWELGPRSLVVALPALAPLLALAWRYYGRHKVWVGLSLVLVALSLANSWVILRNPELPYKSSLPIFYADKLGLPWPELLPDLAGHARISPQQIAAEDIVIENGQPVWFAEAGGPATLAKSDPHAVVAAYPNAHVTYTSWGHPFQVKDYALGITINWQFDFYTGRVWISMAISYPSDPPPPPEPVTRVTNISLWANKVKGKRTITGYVWVDDEYWQDAAGAGLEMHTLVLTLALSRWARLASLLTAIACRVRAWLSV